MGPTWGPSWADRTQVGPMLAPWTLLSGYIMVKLYCISMSQWLHACHGAEDTVYPNKYAHGFVVLCFVVVMQSFIMNSHEVFIHIHQGCFAGTGAIVRLPQCQWSKPDGYGKISQWITTTKHSKAKTVCIFLGIYCTFHKLPHLQFPSHRCGSADIRLSNANVTVVWTREICRHLVLGVPQDIVSANQSF